MSKIFEYYNTGDNQAYAPYNDFWFSQTFTVIKTHTVNLIKTKWRWSELGHASGDIVFGIRATDVNGFPVGSDLWVGTLDSSTIIEDESFGYWYDTVSGDECTLYAPAKYAIVARQPEIETYFVEWRLNTGGSYTGGNVGYSSNGGSTWTNIASYDFMFELWGNDKKGPFPLHYR